MLYLCVRVYVYVHVCAVTSPKGRAAVRYIELRRGSDISVKVRLLDLG